MGKMRMARRARGVAPADSSRPQASGQAQASGLPQGSRIARLQRDLEAAREQLRVAEARQAELQRALQAARGLAALLAQVNHAITNATEEHAMLAQVCELAVEHGGFALAWVALPDSDGWFRPVAASGALTYLQHVRT